MEFLNQQSFLIVYLQFNNCHQANFFYLLDPACMVHGDPLVWKDSSGLISVYTKYQYPSTVSSKSASLFLMELKFRYEKTVFLRWRCCWQALQSTEKTTLQSEVSSWFLVQDYKEFWRQLRAWTFALLWHL